MTARKNGIAFHFYYLRNLIFDFLFYFYPSDNMNHYFSLLREYFLSNQHTFTQVDFYDTLTTSASLFIKI